MSAPDVAAVIRDHATIATGLGEYCCKCSPREWRSIATRSAHVAEALRPVIAAAQAEALREAHERVMGPSDDLRDVGTCLSIANDLTEQIARIGGAR